MIRAPTRMPTERSRMVAGTTAVLLGGLALQLAVYGHGGHSAISDLPRVFLHRGIRPGSLPYVDRPVEYPVLAGLLLYLATLIAPSALGVFLVTAAAAFSACVGITVALERRFGPRAWRWALGAPVLLYAFQNWDVFAIGALLVGLLAYERRHDATAGLAFGIGTAIKLFPIVVVPPLVALRWVKGDRRGARRLAGSTAGLLLVVNLPVALANPTGWWWPFAFQSRRNATWGTAWFYVLRSLHVPVSGTSGAHVANVVSLLALAAALTWLVGVSILRRLEPFSAAAAAVALFVLCNKIYSPTYDVWLVIFFVMLPLSRRLWLTFCAVDLAVFATVYGYFHGVDTAAFVRVVLPCLVVVRTAALVAIVVGATRAPTVPSSRHRSLEPSRSP